MNRSKSKIFLTLLIVSILCFICLSSYCERHYEENDNENDDFETLPTKKSTLTTHKKHNKHKNIIKKSKDKDDDEEDEELLDFILNNDNKKNKIKTKKKEDKIENKENENEENENENETKVLATSSADTGLSLKSMSSQQQIILYVVIGSVSLAVILGVFIIILAGILLACFLRAPIQDKGDMVSKSGLIENNETNQNFEESNFQGENQSIIDEIKQVSMTPV